MSVDTGNLRGNVRTQAHGAPGKLIDELERAQIEVMAGAGQQRLDVLEHRRHHEFVAVGTETVQHQPAQIFNLARLGRQHVGDIFGE